MTNNNQFSFEPIPFARQLITSLQEIAPEVSYSVIWNPILGTLHIEPSNPNVLEMKEVRELMNQAFEALEAKDFPFLLGFIDPEDPILHITNPDLVIPALNQAA
jgi:hypothetical protein